MDRPYASEESLVQDHDINHLADDLRSRLPHHRYIDKIASYSPHYRISSLGSLQKTYNTSITTSKNTKMYIPYEPGRFKVETS